MNNNNSTGTGEALVILGEQLAPIIQREKKLWNVDRNPREHWRGVGEGRKTEVVVMNFFEWLSNETEINERRLRGFSVAEWRTVSLSQAEKILMAFDKYYLLDNGTIHVLPNPNWSLEKWVEYMKERGCF